MGTHIVSGAEYQLGITHSLKSAHPHTRSVSFDQTITTTPMKVLSKPDIKVNELSDISKISSDSSQTKYQEKSTAIGLSASTGDLYTSSATTSSIDRNVPQKDNFLGSRPVPLERTNTAPLNSILRASTSSSEISASIDEVINFKPSDLHNSNKTSGIPSDQKVQRPRLNRFYSLPMTPRSPSRQHFRLHNPHPHHVKETPSISVLEDGRGRFINQYLITQVLGKGSFGMVYLAVDDTGTQYALKECSKQRLAKLNRASVMRLRRKLLLNKRTPDTPNNLEVPSNQPMEMSSLIHREIAIMKKLDHPNLVTLYEVLDNSSSESLILVIEFCSQGSIMPTEENYDGHATPIPLDQARLYFRDLILGVEYLHSRGVCHRDIKADNVLLSDDDVVKLADFGVSEIFETTTSEKGVTKYGDDVMKRPVGSPAYMSPELVLLRACISSDAKRLHPSNAPVSGRKADIWAMGVTLYYMVHGYLPFEAETMDELHSAILYKQPDLSKCPIDLADLFARIFDKNPRTRSSLDELRNHAWVTQGGADPLLPKEENVMVSKDDIITEDDIRDAIEIIRHRRGSDGTALNLNYLDISKSLRTNHGWKGDGSHSRSFTPSHSPLMSDSAHPGNVKMEKLSLALEELINMKDWREHA